MLRIIAAIAIVFAAAALAVVLVFVSRGTTPNTTSASCLTVGMEQSAALALLGPPSATGRSPSVPAVLLVPSAIPGRPKTILLRTPRGQTWAFWTRQRITLIAYFRRGRVVRTGSSSARGNGQVEGGTVSITGTIRNCLR
jgi:hypothetical protein